MRISACFHLTIWSCRLKRILPKQPTKNKPCSTGLTDPHCVFGGNFIFFLIQFCYNYVKLAKSVWIFQYKNLLKCWKSGRKPNCTLLKGNLHPKPKLSMFCILSKKYQQFLKAHTNFWHQSDSNPCQTVIHVFRVWCSIHCITLPSTFLSYWSKPVKYCFDR